MWTCIEYNTIFNSQLLNLWESWEVLFLRMHSISISVLYIIVIIIRRVCVQSKWFRTKMAMEARKIHLILVCIDTRTSKPILVAYRIFSRSFVRNWKGPSQPSRTSLGQTSTLSCIALWRNEFHLRILHPKLCKLKKSLI